VAFTFDSATEQTGTYNVTVDVGDETAASVVELSPSPLPGNDALPQDPNGDGRYEDVDGDGAFDIFDVQAFFGSFTSEVVQQHVPAFDFDSSGSVDIFDVQSLFNQLSG
jgi:PKD repeat protein